jgi:hypothetical protein
MQVSTVLKLTGFATLVGLIVYAVHAASNKVGYKIKGYGIPEPRSDWSFDLPVKVQFNNPTGLSFKVDRVVADVYVWLSNQWQNVAHIDRSITIEPGSHVIELKPTIKLGNLLDDILNALVNISTRKIYTRVDVTASHMGIDFPTQTYEDTIEI